MSRPRALFDGFIIMFIGIVLSIFLMMTVGQIGDKIITILVEDVKVFAVSPEWAADAGKIYTMQSFLFFTCLIPALVGIATFILSAVRRQRYERFVEPPEQDFTAQYEGVR